MRIVSTREVELCVQKQNRLTRQQTPERAICTGVQGSHEITHSKMSKPQLEGESERTQLHQQAERNQGPITGYQKRGPTADSWWR